ncbi:transcriptional repressor NsrR [Gimesia panareensis]|uniref:Transcriptional repressor NsrR n=2 Tax=Gimesia panareensis TaxID=2527978 RepID=A0A517Q5T6_9PLAN|nr:transcriptional repressor NsrR [Gimesia panareensis]
MNMISQTEEYALRAMTCLAFRYPDYMTRDQLFEVTQVPHAYLPKIMLELNRTGLIRSQRGHNGGYTLLRPPSETSLLNIINAVNTTSLRETLTQSASISTEISQLHQHLIASFSRLELALDQTSLADLITQPETL